MSGILVICTTCGVVFDLEIAKTCGGHGKVGPNGEMLGIDRKDRCFICPLGHAGHESPHWWNAKRRDPTEYEKSIGIRFMLTDWEIPWPLADRMAEVGTAKKGKGRR